MFYIFPLIKNYVLLQAICVLFIINIKILFHLCQLVGYSECARSRKGTGVFLFFFIKKEITTFIAQEKYYSKLINTVFCFC